MARTRRHHVPADEKNNAPPSQVLGDAPQSHPKLTHPKMDPISKTLQRDGVVVTGPVPPEVTQTLPDLRTLQKAGKVGRWTRYNWDPKYDPLRVEWVENWEPQIELLQNKSLRERMLISYDTSDENKLPSPKYQPGLAEHNTDEIWVMVMLRPGPGIPLFSKGSHTGKVTNQYLPLDPLNERDIVIFKGNLYRQEPEAKEDGCTVMSLRYS